MPIRSLRHLRGALATIALATVSLAWFAFAATADARSTPAKPTVVLVHGAFADSSVFDAVIDRLRDDGYPRPRRTEPGGRSAVRRCDRPRFP
jgi:pimeloyl-ACP methyl ester carboxylesterase